MVVPLLAEGLHRGFTSIPHLSILVKFVAALAVTYFLKIYFGGARCTSERMMHGKVVMVTVREDLLLSDSDTDQE